MRGVKKGIKKKNPRDMSKEERKEYMMKYRKFGVDEVTAIKRVDMVASGVLSCGCLGTAKWSGSRWECPRCGVKI